MPNSCSDLDLSGEWCKTLGGEEFVLANDGSDDKIVLFRTVENLRRLTEAESLFVDGTFSICPSIFYQVFSIHTMKQEQTFPMVYALLPNKQRQTYSRTLMLMIDAMMTLGLNLSPATVVSDFELAIIQAVSLNFKQVTHRGCYYHFMQALWRKLQSLSLAQCDMSSDPTLKHFVKKMAAISFCPLPFVRTPWLAVQKEAPRIHHMDELVS